MLDQEIIGALVQWMAARTTLPVIQADQGGDEPLDGYILVRLTGTAMLHENAIEVEYLELDSLNIEGLKEIKASPVIETEWRYSIHCHNNPYPTDILRPLRSAAELAQIMEPLMPGLIIHELSQIRNVPEYIAERWEPRAQMDMILRGLTKDGMVIDPIEEFSFNVELR